VDERELRDFLFNSSLDQLSSSTLSSKRIRFAVKTLSDQEAQTELWPMIIEFKNFLKSQSPQTPYAEEIFLRPTTLGIDILIPVIGPKTTLYNHYQVSDVTFSQLGALVVPEFLAEKAQISSFLTLCREFEEQNSGQFLKKILVELNSKDLALHFFL
jgi:hypothetical protein